MHFTNRRHFISSSRFRVCRTATGVLGASFLARGRVWLQTFPLRHWDEAPIDPAKTDLIYRIRRLHEMRSHDWKSWSKTGSRPHRSSIFAAMVRIRPSWRMSSRCRSMEWSKSRCVFSVQELIEKFPKSSCTCTVSCAGIRRYEFNKVKEIKGVAWQEGPIGNAVWSGVRLSDVLKAAGIKAEAKHVWFEADEIVDGQSFSFGGSGHRRRLSGGGRIWRRMRFRLVARFH